MTFTFGFGNTILRECLLNSTQPCNANSSQHLFLILLWILEVKYWFNRVHSRRKPLALKPTAFLDTECFTSFPISVFSLTIIYRRIKWTIQIPTVPRLPLSPKLYRCHKSRHSFVKPKMIPIEIHYHIAPPLVRELMRAEPVFAFIFQYVAPVIVIHRRETAHFLLNAARICVYSLSGYFTPALLSQAGMGKLIFLTN